MNDFPCIHRGPPTGEEIDCGCGVGARKKPVYQCLHPLAPVKQCVTLHGKACLGKRVASCSRCDLRQVSADPGIREMPQWIEPPTPTLTMKERPGDRWRPWKRPGRDFSMAAPSVVKMDHPYYGDVVRHLCYHVGPYSGNGVWQRNVGQLLKRIKLFNGKKVVGVVTGPEFDPPDAVVAEFGGEVDEFLVVENDPLLREVAVLPKLLDMVASTATNEITFCAHTKGVTRPADDTTTVHRWTDIMYETCLDYMPIVEKMLVSHPLAGSFKKVGSGFSGSLSTWHYSGTFYWLRNSEVFRRNWRSYDNSWWGTESWPGVHFRADEGGCIFHEGDLGKLDLYRYKYFHRTVLPAYEKWKAANEPMRTPCSTGS